MVDTEKMIRTWKRVQSQHGKAHLGESVALARFAGCLQVSSNGEICGIGLLSCFYEKKTALCHLRVSAHFGSLAVGTLIPEALGVQNATFLRC